MKIKIPLLTIFLSFFYQVNAQNVLSVDNSPESNAQYDNIAEALAAAKAGDTLLIHPSTINYGDITLRKSIALIGFSHSDPDIRSNVDNITFLNGASDTYLSGLRLSGNIEVSSNTSETLENLIFENNRIAGSILFRGAGADNVLIQGNVSVGIGENNVNQNAVTNLLVINNIIRGNLYVNNHQSTTVKNNIFLNRAKIVNLLNGSGNQIVQDCMFIFNYAYSHDFNSAGIIFENCLTNNYYPNRGVTALSGTNNLNDVDPKFVSLTNSNSFVTTNDYHLDTGSIAIGAGVDGGDLGIYNNDATITFNNFGYTQGIPSVRIVSLTSTIKRGEDLELDIETTSN